jgi:hypothetical protein
VQFARETKLGNTAQEADSNRDDKKISGSKRCTLPGEQGLMMSIKHCSPDETPSAHEQEEIFAKIRMREMG